MTKRISELPAAGGVADTDEFEITQSGVSRKATRGQMVAGLASAVHGHALAEIADAGALAALDTIGAAEIDAAAYASQSEAVAGSDNAKVMTALRTAEAVAAQAAAAVHQHALADITNAGALAALDVIRPTEIDPSAYATQVDAAEGVDGTRIMTAGRTAEAIAAQAAPQQHGHSIADISDAGALAALDLVGAGEIGPNAITSGKILAKAVTTLKLADGAVTPEKIAEGAVGVDQIASMAVTTAKLGDGAVTQQKIADGAVGASKLQPGIPIDMQGAVLTAPELRAHAETSPAPAISAGTLTLDLETGNVFEVTLTQDVTSLILAHPPAAGRAGSCSIILRQDSTGGRTLTWPASVKWAGGSPPPITSAADAVDVYALTTRDGGETWFGFPGGQDFS